MPGTFRLTGTRGKAHGADRARGQEYNAWGNPTNPSASIDIRRLTGYRHWLQHLVLTHITTVPALQTKEDNR
jgi:hypothetical protein